MTKLSVLDRDSYLEQLQSIHALRDQLGLSDQAYRDLLYRLTGSPSAKYMTPEQRQRVITFMSVHKALDEAIERAEEARATLNESYELNPANIMEKIISVDGKREASMHASIEEVIATMRNIHGPEVRLSAVNERRLGNKTVLELFFERPSVFLLAG
jgi:hypothetical protein